MIREAIMKLLGVLLVIVAIIWFGKALYDIWQPLLSIYLAILLCRTGLMLIKWADD